MESSMPRGYSIPLIDLADEQHRQIVVDREPGQYLGHPTTVLLEDNKTMIIVYPKGHGGGAIAMKRSTDAGLTWSDRLPTPASWETSLEVPTLHCVVDANGVKRIIMFSGLYPIRMAVTDDDGATWSELEPIGDFGGIVAMASVVELRTGPGHYMAVFHDNGRCLRNSGEWSGVFNVYKVLSTDGGLTWSQPEIVTSNTEAHLCEGGIVRSPDGNRVSRSQCPARPESLPGQTQAAAAAAGRGGQQLCMLLRENSRVYNSFVIFSDDEGETWTEPMEMPGSRTGDRHTGKYLPDGRLFVSFRDMTLESPTHGDWVGWVGTYDDIVNGREGQYRVRLMDNLVEYDCAYPAVEVLPDGTIVTTTYGHWTEGELAYIVSVSFTLAELDEKARQQEP